MKKLLPISVIAIFAVAPAFADNITASSTCTNGVLGTYTGPADIEANFDPNTINTTWYSNGTQLTGNDIPGTCTYDNALTPPTPEARPGYVFNGWKVKRCEIPNSLVSTEGNASAAKRLSDGQDYTEGEVTAATYGLTEPGQWGVSWASGDKVVGIAICSKSNSYSVRVDTTGTGDAKYCWCKVTGYIANGSQQCELLSSSWKYNNQYSLTDCPVNCAYYCASRARRDSSFKSWLFIGLLAE